MATHSLCVFMAVTATFLLLTDAQKLQYGIMLDAGSSSTKVFIYQWEKTETYTFPNVMTSPPGQTAWSIKSKPGIASFSSNLQGVSSYLAPLVKYAVDKVPKDFQANAVIYLKATAGMRLLSANDSARVLGAVRDYLKDKTVCPFRFEDSWAKVISGEEEGVYDWVSTNVLQKSLGGSTTATWAALDMGGASSQVTFMPAETPLSSHFQARITSYTYNLYTHSFLNFGQDKFIERYLNSVLNTSSDAIVANPCDPAGYVRVNPVPGRNMTGAWDYTSCVHKINALLGLDYYCAQPPCRVLGVYQPDIPATMDMHLFASYYYVASFFNCTGRQRMDCIKSRAEDMCSKGWAKLMESARGQSEEFVRNYCVMAVYINQFLQAIGIEPQRTVHYTSVVNNDELSWTLGGITYEVGAWEKECPAAAASNTSSNKTGLIAGVVVLGIVCFMLLLALIAVVWRSHRAPSQSMATRDEKMNTLL